MEHALVSSSAVALVCGYTLLFVAALIGVCVHKYRCLQNALSWDVFPSAGVNFSL